VRSLVKTILAAASTGVLIAAATSCAAAQAAKDHAGEAGGAALGGLASILLGVSGWVGLAVAGVFGWIGGLFCTPHRALAGGAATGSFPWGILVLGAAIFMVVRSWAHMPAIVKNAWQLIKVAARGFLGGRPNGSA
jgi:hypothetical protein